MRWVVDGCYLVAAVVALPLLILRSLRTGKYRRDWNQRRGWMPELPPGRRRVWIHAVSVGEVNAVRSLITAWREQDPDADLVLSSTTDTGIDRARQLFPDLTVVRYPLDFSRWVRRALGRLRPTLIVLVELEVWYQLVREAAERGIPVAVVNGRVTASKSLRWFGWVLPLVRPMFARLTWVGAQDEVSAERFRHLGVPADRITVTSSLKWDTARAVGVLPGSDDLAAAVGLDRQRPVWVCGSTGPGEEPVILDAFARLQDDHPGLQLVIVPRKPERFDDVAAMITSRGWGCVRRSEQPDGVGAGEPSQTRADRSQTVVILGDTMGELRKFYVLADLVLVGRTLSELGGSDVMEVAALGRPILVGPHCDNFEDAVRRLEVGGALLALRRDANTAGVADELADAVRGLLADPAAARAMGEAGRRVVEANQGATQRTLDRLMALSGAEAGKGESAKSEVRSEKVGK